MSAVWRCAGGQLRRRWRSWLGLALVVAVGGGVVLAAVACARRTDSAYPRFVAGHNAADVLVPGANPFGLVGGVNLDDVRRLPEVGDTAFGSVALLFTGTTDRGAPLGPADIFPISTGDRRIGTAVETWRLRSGRRAAPDRPDEVVVSFVAADRFHLDVGSTFTLHFFRADTFPQVAGKLLSQFGTRLQAGYTNGPTAVQELADGPQIRFHVVGVEASPAEFPPVLAALAPPVHLTPAFDRLYRPQVVTTPVSYVRLRHGLADLPSFRTGVERLGGSSAVSFVSTRDSQTSRVQRSIHIEANAARLLAAVTGLALLVVVGQALARQALSTAAEDETLRALGMTSTQLVGVSMVRGLAVAVVGAAVATAGAVAVSPLTPIGLSRTAEPDPGMAVDRVVLLVGAVLILLVVLVLNLAATLLLMRGRLGRRTRVRRAPQLPVGGLPASGAVGLRFAFDPGRGPTGVPVGATLVGVTLATAILVGVAGFNVSLSRLLDTPRLYGWSWSTYSGAPGLPDIGEALTPAIGSLRGIEAIAVGTVAQVNLENVRVDVLGVERVRGIISTPIVSGRRPLADDEIAVGTSTLRSLHKQVGDTVTASLGDRRERVRIVGRTVLPDIGDLGQLGTGAMAKYSLLQRLIVDARRNVFLVRFSPDVQPESETAVMRSALAPLPTRGSERPPDLASVTRVGSLPNVLTIILVGLAGAILAQTILTSVRQRRRDLAVLKSLGFLRRQVAVAVLAQATALAAVPIVIGVPLGIAAGRWGWVILSNHLGVVAEPVVPITAVAIFVPTAVVVANLLAALPAVVAGRTPAAVVLRSE